VKLFIVRYLEIEGFRYLFRVWSWRLVREFFDQIMFWKWVFIFVLIFIVFEILGILGEWLLLERIENK
jgi:heme/copper-type cytochrome/quinol oxidase subunit 1